MSNWNSNWELLLLISGLNGLWGKCITPRFECVICGDVYREKEVAQLGRHIEEHLKQFGKKAAQFSSALGFGAKVEDARREILGFDSPEAALDFLRSGKVMAP